MAATNRAEVAHQNRNSSSSIDWRLILFLTATVVYFIVFFRWTPERWLGLWVRMSWLLVPDVPLMQWLGGDGSRFGWHDRVTVLVAAAAILGTACAAGALCLNAMGALSGLSRLEAFLFAQAIGLNVVSSFTLAVGMAGQLRSGGIFAAAAMVVLAPFCWRARAMRAALAPAPTGPPTPVAPWWLRPLPALGIGAPFAAVILLGSMLPPWQFDVREYHSQVPKEWFQEGRVSFLPHNVYGNMPLAAELPSVLGTLFIGGQEGWWWGALVGKVIIGSYSILAALSIYAFGRRFFSAPSGAAAALLFISTPWVGFVSMAGLIEGPSATYALLTLHGLLLWNTAERAQHGGSLAMAGMLAGAAVACKYPALLFVAFPAASWVIWASPRRGVPSWKAGAIFLLGMTLGTGLWLAKNAAYTGNPVYPLLYEVFGGKSRNEAKHEQWTRAHRAPPNGVSLAALRQSCLTLLVDSQRTNADERTSALLVPFALLGLLSRYRSKLCRLLAGYLLVVFAGWWLLTHRLDRFLIPHLPIVAMLAGLGITWARGRATAILVAIVMVANLLLISSQSLTDNRFLVALDDLRQIGPEDLNEYNPHIHPAHLYLNENVRDGHRALLCGEAQVFNLRVPILYNTCFDDCVLELVLGSRSRDERLAELRRRRISHVMVYWHELDRYRSAGNYGYSDFATRKLVRQELVAEQRILVPIRLEMNPENCELFEVAGWRSWP